MIVSLERRRHELDPFTTHAICPRIPSRQDSSTLMITKLTLICLLLAGNLFAEPIHRHIFFKLDLPKGSPAEKEFVEKTMALAKLPTVEKFIWMDVLNSKEQFTHGVCIVFKDEAAMNTYVQAREHRQYIRDVWKPVVTESQLTDYTEGQVVSAK
jgi:hypothetical protein